MKNTFKKVVGILLTVTMLASLVVLPVTVGATVTEFTDNFDYTATEDLTVKQQMESNGWSLPSNFDENSITGDGLKLPKTMKRSLGFTGAETGLYEIKFSIKPETIGNYIFYFDTNHSDTAFQDNPGIAYFKSAAAANGEYRVYGMLDGDYTNVFSASLTSLCVYSAGKTYDVSVIINMDERNYTVKVKSSDSSEKCYQASWTYAFKYGNEYPTKLNMDISGTAYMSNFSLGRTERYIIKDDFNSYSSMADDATIETALTNNGWKIYTGQDYTDCFPNGEHKLIKGSNRFYAAFGEGQNDRSTYEIKFSVRPTAATDKAMIYFMTNYSEQKDPARTNGWEYQHYLRAVEFYSGTIYKPNDTANYFSIHGDRTVASSKLGTYTPGYTYDVVITYKAGKSYSATITEKNTTGAKTGVVYTYDYSRYFDYDVDFATYSEAKTWTNASTGATGTSPALGDAYIKRIQIEADSADTVCYLDNFSIRNIGEYPSVDKIDIDFEDNGYLDHVTGNSAYNIYEIYNEYGDVINKAALVDEVGVWKKLNLGVDGATGKYYLDFTIIPEAISTNGSFGYMFFLGGGNPLVVIKPDGYFYGNGCAADDKGQATAYSGMKKLSTAQVQATEPIYVSAVIDYDADTAADATTGAVGTAGKVDTVIKQGDTEISYSSYLRTKNSYDETHSDYNILCFRTDAASGQAGFVYIDDIMFGEAKTPSIGVSGITMKDTDGNAIANTLTDVTPKVDEITLDFGTPNIKESTLRNITISSNGNEILYLPEFDAENGKVTLDILDTIQYRDSSNAVQTKDYWLTPGATYTITVPAAVANVYGDTLGTSYVHTFTVAAGAYTVEVTGLTSAGTAITVPGDITANMALTAGIAYNNSTTAAETLNCIIAYYNADKKLVAVEASESIAVPSSSSAETTVSFTAPADVTDVSSVKIFVWNDMTSLAPVGDSWCIPAAN